jgi:hypothetical protein
MTQIILTAALVMFFGLGALAIFAIAFTGGWPKIMVLEIRRLRKWDFDL